MGKLKCSFCGSQRKVFLNTIFNKEKHQYTIAPVCLKCKTSELSLCEVKQWEKELKNLETQISKCIVSDYFPKIKFKDFAEKKLVGLMKKYSVRKVLEVCVLYNGDFNLHKIEEKCKGKYK